MWMLFEVGLFFGKFIEQRREAANELTVRANLFAVTPQWADQSAPTISSQPPTKVLRRFH
jgi:Sec-independent protein secretion pathway component TatC